jgi:hypothetical protein
MFSKQNLRYFFQIHSVLNNFKDIDAHGLKIQGKGPSFYDFFVGGRGAGGVYRGLWKDTPFRGFTEFLLTSFLKTLEGGSTWEGVGTEHQRVRTLKRKLERLVH